MYNTGLFPSLYLVLSISTFFACLFSTVYSPCPTLCSISLQQAGQLSHVRPSAVSGSDLRAAAHFRLGPSCNSILPGYVYILSLGPRSKRYIECRLLFQYHQRRCDLFHASLISLFLGSWPFSPTGICTVVSKASETLKKSGPKYNSPGLVWGEASGISAGERPFG